MIRSTVVALFLVLFGFQPCAKAQEIESPKIELYCGYDYVRYNANSRINGVPPSESFGANGITGQAASFCGWARNSLSLTKHNGVMK